MITKKSAFRDCMQLLNLQSQATLIASIKQAIHIINTNLKSTSPLKPFSPINSPEAKLILDEKDVKWCNFLRKVRVVLMTFVRDLGKASQDSSYVTDVPKQDAEIVPMNRRQLKEVSADNCEMMFIYIPLY